MRKIKILSFAIIFFLFGYFINAYKIVFIWKINSFIKNFKNSSSLCIPETKNIPQNSMIIVGHAYGNPLSSVFRGDQGISPKLTKVLKNNAKQINEIVFSGDVLHNPSLKRWENLFSELENFKIYIAPGNHDVGLGNDSAKRDIFKMFTQNSEINNNYPFFFKKDNSLFIIDDSNLLRNSLKKIIEIISNNNKFKKVFIIRHHILTKSMSKLTNGIPSHPLIEEKFLKKEMDLFKDKEIIFIYGDGGSSHRLSLYCREIGNVKHLINGIGENNDDIILIFNNNNLYFKFI